MGGLFYVSGERLRTERRGTGRTVSYRVGAVVGGATPSSTVTAAAATVTAAAAMATAATVTAAAVAGGLAVVVPVSVPLGPLEGGVRVAVATATGAVSAGSVLLGLQSLILSARLQAVSASTHTQKKNNI